MKRILLVDDHSAARGALRMFLEHKGYFCYEAEHGAAALSWLQGEYPVDLVITDNQMPVMDGLKLLDKLAELSLIKTVPVILYSGNLTNELKDRALKTGAFAVLAKPYNFYELVETVVKALSPR